MSLVNQVPKIVPDDFETMLNSNINVSTFPGIGIPGIPLLPLLRTSERNRESWPGTYKSLVPPLASLRIQIGRKDTDYMCSEVPSLPLHSFHWLNFVNI